MNVYEEDEIEGLLSAQGEMNFSERPSSSPDLATPFKNDDDFRRCHSWNGCTAHEREEMNKFFVEEEGDSNKQTTEGGEGNDSKYSRYLRKAGAAVVGGSMVGAGIILIPLPGPGILVMGAGASVLAKEFPAAQRAIDGAKDSLNSLMESAKARTSKKEENGAADAADTSTSSTISNEDGNVGGKEEGMEQTLEGSNPPPPPAAAEDATNSTTPATTWGSKYKTNFLSMGRSLKDGFDKGAKKMYEKSKRFGTIDQLGSKSDLATPAS